MRTSEQIDQIVIALALAQGEFKPAKKSGKNHFFATKSGPNKDGSRYSTLDDINEACKDALAKNNLAVLQNPRTVDGRIVITTTIMHKSGQWIESDELSLRPDKDTVQAYGSTITYGRRYQLGPLLGISSDDDDDGNAASGLGDGDDNGKSNGKKPFNKPYEPPKQELPKDQPGIFTKAKGDCIKWFNQVMDAQKLPNGEPFNFKDRKAILEQLEGKEASLINMFINQIKNKNQADSTTKQAQIEEDPIAGIF